MLNVMKLKYSQDIRDLYGVYKTRMESEGKKVKSGGGFWGTGFKFDEAEAQYTMEKRNSRRLLLACRCWNFQSSFLS